MGRMQGLRMGLGAAIIAALMEMPAWADEEFSPYVDAQGQISLPEDFRTSMVHQGSWFLPAGGASGFHDV